MPEPLHIKSSCVVRNYSISANDSDLFAGSEKNLADFLIAAYKHFNFEYPKFYKMDLLSKLGWLGTELLLKDFEKSKYQSEDIGVVLSNANSSLDTDLRYFESVKSYPSPALFVYTLPNIVIGEICIRHNLKGENAFFVFEEFDANFIEQYVSGLINNNILQACICGWVDVLKESHKAALFLVEKGGDGMDFTAENMSRLFEERPGT